MNIITPEFNFEDVIRPEEILSKLERAGRTCYKSEGKIGDGSSERFLKSIIARGHESVLEHVSVSVRIICDRGVTHEIVRHRVASYSQESTRYCNYSQEKFGRELTFIRPCFWNTDEEKYEIWLDTMRTIEKAYLSLIDSGATPEEARSILPNSLKTEIVMSANLREWRHFFKLRTSYRAHPQMREIACMMLEGFKKEIPIIFDDISETEM